MENLTNSPMQPEVLANAPRCGAKTRMGSPCLAPAVRGRRRCRMHGGLSQGAPKDNKRAWKHGDRSAETEAQLKYVRKIGRAINAATKLREGESLRPAEIELLFDLMMAANLGGLEFVEFPGRD